MKFSEMVEMEPKIELSEEGRYPYKLGLSILSAVSDDLVDLSLVPKDRFSEEGYFYEIPYLHSDILYTDGNKYDLLVVYHISKTAEGNMSSSCPIRIYMEHRGTERMRVTAVNQIMSYDNPVRNRVILEKTAHGYETSFDTLGELRLTDLVEDWSIQTIQNRLD